MRKPTPEELEKLRNTTKGCNRALLAEWGIPWPPPSGWRKKLLRPERTKPLTIRERLGRSCTPIDLIRLKVEVRRLYGPFIEYYQPYPMDDPHPYPEWPEELEGLTEEEIQAFIAL
jgi:hypothetical protein